jgi:hypothetical protein
MTGYASCNEHLFSAGIKGYRLDCRHRWGLRKEQRSNSAVAQRCGSEAAGKKSLEHGSMVGRLRSVYPIAAIGRMLFKTLQLPLRRRPGPVSPCLR